jgi:hypothetical protein
VAFVVVVVDVVVPVVVVVVFVVAFDQSCERFRFKAIQQQQPQQYIEKESIMDEMFEQKFSSNPPHPYTVFFQNE